MSLINVWCRRYLLVDELRYTFLTIFHPEQRPRIYRIKMFSTRFIGLCWYHHQFGHTNFRCHTPNLLNAIDIKPSYRHVSTICYIADYSLGIFFLIDTGAEFSLLAATPWDKMNREQGQSLKAVNNSVIPTFGEQTLLLNLDGMEPVEWTFIVADIQCSVLGCDFLNHHKLIVDISEKRLIQFSE